MGDVIQTLRRAKPHLTEDLLGVCALAVIIIGAVQIIPLA